MLGRVIVMFAQLFTAWIRWARTLGGGKGLRPAKISTTVSAIMRQTRFTFLAFIFSRVAVPKASEGRCTVLC